MVYALQGVEAVFGRLGESACATMNEYIIGMWFHARLNGGPNHQPLLHLKLTTTPTVDPDQISITRDYCTIAAAK
jgi:hypothetical protein